MVTGPGGHTQRLLTVVKSGSIQDVKSKPQDKVHVWPHLLVVEFVASLFITAFTLLFSIFVNAPLLELANYNQTPNPSKAPWYFLGLQELLTMFHPMVAGVTIPGIGLLALILAPIVTIIAVGHGFFQMIMGRRALRSHFVGAAAPLLMLLVAGSILSGDSPSLGWFVIPGVGMIVTAAAQGILFAEAMVEGDRNPA